MLLLGIVVFPFAGGVLGVMAAGTLLLLSDRLRERVMPALVSFAIGALLGAAFLAILPHALEGGEVSVHGIALTVLLSLLAFFLLEKMVLWRHCHAYDCEVHGTSHDEHGHGGKHGHTANNGRFAIDFDQMRTKATGGLILVGDGI